MTVCVTFEVKNELIVKVKTIHDESTRNRLPYLW